MRDRSAVFRAEAKPEWYMLASIAPSAAVQVHTQSDNKCRVRQSNGSKCMLPKQEKGTFCAFHSREVNALHTHVKRLERKLPDAHVAAQVIELRQRLMNVYNDNDPGHAERIRCVARAYLAPAKAGRGGCRESVAVGESYGADDGDADEDGGDKQEIASTANELTVSDTVELLKDAAQPSAWDTHADQQRSFHLMARNAITTLNNVCWVLFMTQAQMLGDGCATDVPQWACGDYSMVLCTKKPCDGDDSFLVTFELSADNVQKDKALYSKDYVAKLLDNSTARVNFRHELRLLHPYALAKLYVSNSFVVQQNDVAEFVTRMEVCFNGASYLSVGTFVDGNDSSCESLRVNRDFKDGPWQICVSTKHVNPTASLTHNSSQSTRPSLPEVARHEMLRARLRNRAQQQRGGN